MTRPVLMALPLLPADLLLVRQAASGVRGGGLQWRAARLQRPLPADSRARGCQVERAKMEMFEGLVGQHTARCPHAVSRSFAPPRAVMLTLCRCPDGDDAQVGPWTRAHTGTLVKNGHLRLMRADTGLRIVGLWLPNGGALRLQVGGVRRPPMRLSDGCLALWCTHQRQAHIVRCTPHLLAPERLQLPSSFGGGSDLLGRLVNMGFRDLVWQRRVVRRRVQIRTVVFWFWDGWHPCVDGRRALHTSSFRISGWWYNTSERTRICHTK